MQRTVTNVLNLKEYTPSETVNKTMSALVETVTTKRTVPFFIRTDKKQQLRTICAKTESELESYWAKRIIAAVYPAQELLAFPYRNNYTELTRRELLLAKQTGLTLTHESSLLVIGSGPLPLSAIEMHLQTGASVDHIDSDAEAIRICQELTTVLHMPSQAYLGKGQTITLEKSYDLILIAALAGETREEKQAIIDNILPVLNPRGRVVIRSAKGQRSLLYPAVKSHDFRHISLLSEYHPADHIINSVFVYKKENA